MQKNYCLALCLLLSIGLHGQEVLTKLSVEKIMRDPIWMGTSPSAPFWNETGEKLYFFWNPSRSTEDSLYYITRKNLVPVKATVFEKNHLVEAGSLVYNLKRTAYVYNQDGDIYLRDIRSGKLTRITQTAGYESAARFSFADSKVIYERDQNLYAWNVNGGQTTQLTNFPMAGGATDADSRMTDGTPKMDGSREEDWLETDQLKYFEVLRARKQRREEAEKYNQYAKEKDMRKIPLNDKMLLGLDISPDGRFITYRLSKRVNGKTTVIPDFVTESGYTTDIIGRGKVGMENGSSESYIYDRQRDTVILLKTDSIPGIKDIPEYFKDYPKELEQRKKLDSKRAVNFSGPLWSADGAQAVYNISSRDHKDFWIMLWDTGTARLKLLARDHDSAWLDGPSFYRRGWIDNNNFWYISEQSGYAHIYVINVRTGYTTALTHGIFEVQEADISTDKKYFYITTNQVHPGEQQFYKLTISNGKMERITQMTGANEVKMSPDEKELAIIYSYSNKPWELYLQENTAGSKATKITNLSESDEFRSYSWRDPEIVTFKARDGATVYARLYKPAKAANGNPAVLFVHGAGYLQNAHKWWSSYFREYMFNNLLADNGYYVMDVDYRGSAGYGRDWRTGIYRNMGGKDLSDNVDAVGWLVKNYGVSPGQVGLYGGSYGGFITLMALFKEPEVFVAGAALRPVTDWANYNQSYTSNILNEPFNDSLAYQRSSPLYFAEGLKGSLLICHGMVDVNVHFQDAVKLTERLIELGKDNWQLAAYPLEGHGFIEPVSWTDEYKRIFKLFESTLKK